MANKLRLFRVDWGWRERSELERAVIRKYHPQLDTSGHSVDSFATVLARASAELPAIEIVALVEDHYRARTLVLARAGASKRIAIKDTTHRGQWAMRPWLPLDSVVTPVKASKAQEVWDVLCESNTADTPLERNGDELELPLSYRSERHLRWAMELVADAMIGPLAQFVAQIGHHRHLVTLRSKSVQIEPLIQWPSSNSEFHERQVEGLLAADPEELFPVVVSARRRMATHPGGTKLDQAIYLPESQLHDIEHQAVRTDRSLSWVVQEAWRISRESVVALPSRDAARAIVRHGDRTRKRKLHFPGEMLVEIEDVAERLGCSVSWIVQAAYAIARSSIAALPAPEQGDEIAP
ncbi:MAG: hypothetical protein AB7P03_27300 [Kofleriaceae bacterium]